MARPKYIGKQRYIEALEKYEGAIGQAAEYLGVHPSAVYQAMDRWPEVKRVRERIIEKYLDIAEKNVKRWMQDGDKGATYFYLKCFGAKSRGWQEKHLHQLEGGDKPIQIQADIKQQMDLDALKKAIQEAKGGKS